MIQGRFRVDGVTSGNSTYVFLGGLHGNIIIGAQTPKKSTSTGQPSLNQKELQVGISRRGESIWIFPIIRGLFLVVLIRRALIFLGPLLPLIWKLPEKGSMRPVLRLYTRCRASGSSPPVMTLIKRPSRRGPRY